MIGAMEGFKQLFSSAHPLKKIIRGMGLNLVDNLPMVKEKMIKHAMGLD
jgi:2-octaprenylphenol hydroxylase